MAEKDNWLLAGAKQDGESITKEWKPTTPSLIDGVIFQEIKPVLTAYGSLTEIFRTEWVPDAAQIGQIFASTLEPGGLSAWHAHAITTDRLFVAAGQMRVVLYDARADSPTFGMLNEFKLGTKRPGLLVVPPRVWHGVQNYCSTPAILVNAVDHAYRYDAPDHWRVPADSETVPYRFSNDRHG
ncbi:dTDP-4-dehydrorhamnose 3,5-epimerase family protein [Janthinobacterium lividum]|uniref:dTDP-4-dehydrorhamnose 3,5-epimerase family protein n=1 Tax=Janthinobacterium lividum TaxID=29581 RepID=UPI00159540ED|nr:dTDP-4-dehydrorhamnose 3,5-epimerase family protein [Janthinobacterium lividum]QKY06932.1 dTDP-4-dehydrorhamnose 3,5-epimerase [Janthinobacterium lividum]